MYTDKSPHNRRKALYEVKFKVEKTPPDSRVNLRGSLKYRSVVSNPSVSLVPSVRFGCNKRLSLPRLWVRSLRRSALVHWRAISLILLALTLEVVYHVWSYQVPKPGVPVDRPFYSTCQEPDPYGPRANATFVMLARNSDRASAASAVANLERQFNRWYHYPVVFLNDAPWEQAFKGELARVASGEVEFAQIDAKMWGFPDWMDQEEAQRKMAAQEASGLMYAGTASYHHMCRFYSG